MGFRGRSTHARDLVNKKVDREKRGDESTKVGKDGEVSETGNARERQIHVSRKV